MPFTVVDCGDTPDRDSLSFSGSASLIGDARFGCWELGDRGRTGGRIDGVVELIAAMGFAVAGCDGELGNLFFPGSADFTGGVRFGS